MILQETQPSNPSDIKKAEAPLAPGTPAPDFTLPIILFFYPADWSPVCGDQAVLYNELNPIFQSYNAQVLGISVDGIWSHKAFTDHNNLQFPLLSDFEPKGAVARMYGVYRDEGGTSERALFVIDSEGIIRWSYVSPVSVNPGADGILTALEKLKS
jgi:peroxiredoxin